MPIRDFESTVSVKLLHPDHGDALFSAILERDPHFLHWNRISLIGSLNDYQRFLPISSGLLEWELYDNPDWPEPGGDQLGQRTFGTAIVHQQGMAGGISIANDGIQKFADLTIHRHVETHTLSDGELSAIYAFLQRPTDWYAYPRRSIDSLPVRGEWRSVHSLGLKLRLLTNGHRRKDSRVSQEVELIEVPGVEIRTIADKPSGDFVTDAEKLWFSIRVLLMFRFRQSVIPLFEQVSTPEQITMTWHCVEVEPRREINAFEYIDFSGRVDNFIAKAVPRLASYGDERRHLHAAAWCYAASFGPSVLEAQLTDRIEAIEGLVAVFEKTAGLDRDRFSRKNWKSVKSALKKTVDDLDIDEELAKHLKRGFASSPTLTLQEGIERMATEFSESWNLRDQGLLKGLDTMIAARNAIVHGRLIDNIDRLALEALRAQVIFEKLFLGFFGCDEYHSSGYAQQTISSLERRLKEHGDG